MKHLLNTSFYFRICHFHWRPLKPPSPPHPPPWIGKIICGTQTKNILFLVWKLNFQPTCAVFEPNSRIPSLCRSMLAPEQKLVSGRKQKAIIIYSEFIVKTLCLSAAELGSKILQRSKDPNQISTRFQPDPNQISRSILQSNHLNANLFPNIFQTHNSWNIRSNKKTTFKKIPKSSRNSQRISRMLSGLSFYAFQNIEVS